MKLLAIETCTEACSAAVYIDGEVVERYQIAARQHNELILPMVEEVLAEAQINLSQLDGLAFGCGPGAFTGVRICVAVSQGIAFAHDLPLLGISSLANLAAQAPASEQGEQQQVLAAIDARMAEIYAGQYTVMHNNSVPILFSAEQVITAEALDLGAAKLDYGIGTGWQSDAETLLQKTDLEEAAVDAAALPRASVTARLAAMQWQQATLLTAEQAQPTYLRNNVVHQKQTKGQP
ncbi:MAG: tRNA (adenosine(37)-N6)-threonylcarbamoyltransferase complex dimerization subunit type 1 TsaB [Gammaproteobacteria bacterium]|nr:tRNA (adenosine(37)-N6)-threonylcarbamoyltransferase complex dimerization subunit type 1 TsaB [Gammaproteobacteria bacterium]